MADSIHFEYAVYVLPTRPAVSSDLSALFKKAAAKYSDLRLVEEVPREPQGMLVHAYLNTNATRDYAPPDSKYAHDFGRGLNLQQEQALQTSTSAIILDFGHPKRNVWMALHTANELAEEIARKTGGLVWDEETREVFSPDAWHKKRLASWSTDVPDVSTQTLIHIYPNGEYARAITLGMSKMGLPDVVVEESPWSSDNQVGNLINIFSQAIAEGQNISNIRKFRLDLHAIKNDEAREAQLKSLKTNGLGVACPSLSEAKWEEGDPKNRLIMLESDEYPGNDSHAKQDNMISSFFGSEDSVTKVRHNAELLAASTKAKSKLPELHKAFNAGLAPGEFIEVKAPFSADNGGREWMWVEVNSWTGDQIKGVLENDPSEVTALHAGQIVRVREEDVFDYIRQYPDKHREGNTTGEIVRKLSEGEQSSAPQILVPSCSAN